MYVGQHVQVAVNPPRNGCVRYIGPLQGATGTWVGIEWDIPNVGRHDGIHNGQRYFETAPYGASFVRPDKCTEGINFTDAILDRYLDERTVADETVETSFNKPLQVLYTENLKRGRRTLQGLSFLGLNDMGIKEVGDGAQELMQDNRVRELDLSRSLFSTWQVLEDILSLMPHLEKIHCDGIKLNGRSSKSFSRIKEVTFSHTKALSLAKIFPESELVNLAFNALNDTRDVDISPNVSFLCLAGNFLSDWTCIQALVLRCPSLRSLDLSRNHVQVVSCPVELEYLDMSFNDVDWDAVASIGRTATLKDLTVYANSKLTGPGSLPYRTCVIAICPHLERLDHSDIGQAERTEAESAFVKANSSYGSAPRWINEAVERLSRKYGAADKKVLPNVELWVGKEKIRLVRSARVSSLRAKMKRLGLAGTDVGVILQDGSVRVLESTDTLENAGLMNDDRLVLV